LVAMEEAATQPEAAAMEATAPGATATAVMQATTVETEATAPEAMALVAMQEASAEMEAMEPGATELGATAASRCLSNSREYLLMNKQTNKVN